MSNTIEKLNQLRHIRFNNYFGLGISPTQSTFPHLSIIIALLLLLIEILFPRLSSITNFDLYSFAVKRYVFSRSIIGKLHAEHNSVAS